MPRILLGIEQRYKISISEKHIAPDEKFLRSLKVETRKVLIQILLNYYCIIVLIDGVKCTAESLSKTVKIHKEIYCGFLEDRVSETQI